MYMYIYTYIQPQLCISMLSAECVLFLFLHFFLPYIFDYYSCQTNQFVVLVLYIYTHIILHIYVCEYIYIYIYIYMYI